MVEQKKKGLTEEIRQRLKVLDKILSASPDNIAILDRDGRNLYVNKSTAEALGVKQSDAFGKTWHGLGLPPDVVEPLEANLKSVFSTGEPITAQVSMPTVYGIRDCEYTLTPIKEDGTVSLVVGTTTDITEQKRVEEDLKESEERLKSIIDSTTAVIYIKDTKGRYILINRRHETLFHIPKEEIRGKTDDDIFPEAIAKTLKENDRKVLETGTPIEFEEIVPYESELHTYISIKFPLRDSKGAIYAVCGISTDITERKRAEENVKEERRLSDALNEINATMSSTLDIDEMMGGVVAEASKAVGTEATLIALRENGSWMPKYAYGWPQGLIGTRFTDREARTTILDAETKTVVTVNDAYNDGRVNREVMEKYGIRSLLSAPLIVKGNIIGVIAFSYHLAPIAFTEAQVDFARKLAAAVSIAMENARLFEELTILTDELDEKSKGLQALLDVALDVTSGLKLDELMHKVAKNATELTGADVGAVGLVHEETRAVTYPFIYFLPGTIEKAGLPPKLPELIAKTSVPPGKGMSERVISKKRPLIVDDYQEFPDRVPIFVEAGLRAVAMVPLWSRGRIIGTLAGSNLDPEKKFDERDIKALEGIGRHAAIALENARLYETERHIADTLQESLLIMPEHIEGIEFGHIYRSATEAARVGGDFYDIFEIEHGKIGIVVGDISGKGIEATTLTSVVKNAIKAHAYEDGTPALILAKVNDMLVRVSPPSDFVTVFFGVLDAKTGELTYCSAGHPPAIIKRRAGSVDLLNKHSPIIGAFLGVLLEDSKETLKKGDMLLLYTDGIIEARFDGKFYGEGSLVDFITNLAPVPAKEVPGLILNDVIQFTDGKLTDDVALLAVSLEK